MSALEQADLFDNRQSTCLVADALGTDKPAGKAQAEFRRSIRRIGEQRARIEEWRAYQVRYAQRLADEVMPLQTKLREKRRRMAFLLDEMFDRPSAVRGKRLRGKLQCLIVDVVSGLLAEEAEPDLIALNDKHSDLTHADLDELDAAMQRDMIEHLFGVRVAEDEAATPEEILDKAMREMGEREHQAAETRRTRKKSPRTEAAEAKRAEAEKQVSQSVREVYRKLASALHPDRATEHLDRAHKTALMQRVNKAYDNDDLLELLTIQLEIEQIDADHLANLPAERIGHYNRVLKEQLAELQAEIQSIVGAFVPLVGYVREMKPAYLEQALTGHIAELVLALGDIDADLERFRDPPTLCRTLKNYDPDERANDLIADMDMLIGQLFSEQRQSRPPRRKKANR